MYSVLEIQEKNPSSFSIFLRNRRWGKLLVCGILWSYQENNFHKAPIRQVEKMCFCGDKSHWLPKCNLNWCSLALLACDSALWIATSVFSLLSFQSITEWLRLEGTSGRHLVLSPCGETFCWPILARVSSLHSSGQKNIG